MLMELSAVLALAERCAPNVAPETLVSVVRTESGFNPLAINVNKGAAPVRQPRTKAEAVRAAATLLRAGANFDLGLGQINSRNLRWLGLTVETAFEPCANLSAAGRVLRDNYQRTAQHTANPQQALRQALSLYNTGDVRRGFANGYVGRVEAAAATIVPAISVSSRPDAKSQRDLVERPQASIRLTAEPAEQPAWDVFARRGAAPMVFASGSQER